VYCRIIGVVFISGVYHKVFRRARNYLLNTIFVSCSATVAFIFLALSGETEIPYTPHSTHFLASGKDDSHTTITFTLSPFAVSIAFSKTLQRLPASISYLALSSYAPSP